MSSVSGGSTKSVLTPVKAVSALVNSRNWITSYSSLRETLGRRIRAETIGWVHNFYTYYFCGLILSGLIGGAIIAGIDSLPYLDGFFLSVSALTCTGLGTVPMAKLSTGSFVVLALECFFGQSFMAMNVYPSIGRYIFSRRRSRVMTIKERTIELNMWVMVSYNILWHAFGILTLIGALRLRLWNAELQARNFTREAQALFLTICAFANAGYTLTSDSIYDMTDNPLAYCIVALLIAAGCTMAPPFLRAYIYFLRWFKTKMLKDANVEEYDELLAHGEEYSIYLFFDQATRHILTVNLAIAAFQFLMYLFSELIRKDALDAYGGVSILVGMGFFQAVSTRYAGFQIMDLRLVSNGMLVVYAICMYLPPTPGVDEIENPSFRVVQLEDDSDLEGESVKRHGSNDSIKVTGGGGDSDSISIKRRTSLSSICSVEDGEGRHRTSFRIGTKVRASSMRFTKNSIEDKIASWLEGAWARAIKRIKNQDLWLIISIIVLSFTEDKLMKDSPETCNIFYLWFEILSAYGNVGLSLGVPNKPYSLSGEFSKMGYLVIIFVMYMGKHRGMPAVDALTIDFYHGFRDKANFVSPQKTVKPDGDNQDRKQLDNSIPPHSLETELGDLSAGPM